MGERNRRMIVEGLDMIGMSLQHRAAIEQFETTHFAALPWMRVLDPA